MRKTAAREVIEHRRQSPGRAIPPKTAENVEMTVPVRVAMTRELETSGYIKASASLRHVAQTLEVNFRYRYSTVIRVTGMLAEVFRWRRKISDCVPHCHVLTGLQARRWELKVRT
jgi:hypothetical protein